jgi:hypothetical protein
MVLLTEDKNWWHKKDTYRKVKQGTGSTRRVFKAQINLPILLTLVHLFRKQTKESVRPRVRERLNREILLPEDRRIMEPIDDLHAVEQLSGQVVNLYQLK